MIGEEKAETLMSMLPPVGWADVATKHDIDALRVATKHDIDALRVATKHDIDALRLEMRALELGIEAKLERSLRQQLHVLLFALIGAMASMTTVNLAAVALLR